MCNSCVAPEYFIYCYDIGYVWIFINFGTFFSPFWLIKEKSSDDDSAEEEAREAERIRREKAKSSTREDFGLEDDSEDESNRESTFEVRFAENVILLGVGFSWSSPCDWEWSVNSIKCLENNYHVQILSNGMSYKFLYFYRKCQFMEKVKKSLEWY